MKDLFEDIREEMGCTYISDIRIGKNRIPAACKATCLCLNQYALSQYNDFAEYMFYEKKEFSSALEFAAYLEDKMESETKAKRGNTA